MSSVNACNTARIDGFWLAGDGLGRFAKVRHAAMNPARDGVVTSLVKD